MNKCYFINALYILISSMIQFYCVTAVFNCHSLSNCQTLNDEIATLISLCLYVCVQQKPKQLF